MSMHMIRGVREPTSKKRKSKKKVNMDEMVMQWCRHNKDMKRLNCHTAQFETVTEYVKYTTGNLRFRKKIVSCAPEPRAYRVELPDAPILSNSVGNGFKKEAHKYTGTLIKGIATMHKSNAVPIINEQQAIEIAQMRRN